MSLVGHDGPKRGDGPVEAMVPVDGRLTALRAFDRDLGREAHALREGPEILWQQLHNRLQWEDEAVQELLAARIDRLGAPGARPWLRTLTRFPESESLIRTLAGHTNRVGVCAYSPDGRRIVSASTDGTLRVWDAERGVELAILAGRPVEACAFSPDGRRIVSAGNDNSLKVWDAETGAN